jgi:PTH1 family peptidyl-tRNA hydrolase
MRIRRKGTDGGHNGIKSIIYHLQSDNFPRIKIGVGKKPSDEYDLKDWVLSRFSEKEQKELLPVFENAADAVELIINGRIDEAMNKYNS